MGIPLRSTLERISITSNNPLSSAKWNKPWYIPICETRQVEHSIESTYTISFALLRTESGIGKTSPLCTHVIFSGRTIVLDINSFNCARSRAFLQPVVATARRHNITSRRMRRMELITNQLNYEHANTEVIGRLNLESIRPGSDWRCKQSEANQRSVYHGAIDLNT